MKRQIALLALVIVFGLVSSAAQTVPEGSLDGLTATTEHTVTSTVFGHTVSWTVTEPDLEATPGWPGPDSQEPPLSVSRAVAVAKAELGSYLPEVTEWQLEGVRLERLGWRGKWFYVVEWKALRHHRGDFLEIPVLMSGRPVRLDLSD